MIKILVIVGPTASGKSDLALKLAKDQNGEIISADSRQIYRGLDIGTAKPVFDTKDQNTKIKTWDGVPHWLFDVADVDDDYNVSHFIKDAKEAIEDIASRGKLPIVVGGSGFWIDSLVFGYELPKIVPDENLRRTLEKKSTFDLMEELSKFDPHRAKHIDKHNKRRLIRAIELVHATREPIPQLKSIPQYDASWIGIKIPKEELFERITKRLDKQFKDGLIDEAKKLSHPEKFGLAYMPISKYLKGEISEEEMREQSLRATYQYAKRQITWFKRNINIRWIADVNDGNKEEIFL